MTRSYFRGYPIIRTNERWVYEDTGETIDIVRPCKKCGELFQADDIDPCLGELPGVENACCGHGVSERAYIKFESGVIVRGFPTIQYTERGKSHNQALDQTQKDAQVS